MQGSNELTPASVSAVLNNIISKPHEASFASFLRVVRDGVSLPQDRIPRPVLLRDHGYPSDLLPGGSTLLPGDVHLIGLHQSGDDSRAVHALAGGLRQAQRFWEQCAIDAATPALSITARLKSLWFQERRHALVAAVESSAPCSPLAIRVYRKCYRTMGPVMPSCAKTVDELLPYLRMAPEAGGIVGWYDRLPANPSVSGFDWPGQVTPGLGGEGALRISRTSHGAGDVGEQPDGGSASLSQAPLQAGRCPPPTGSMLQATVAGETLDEQQGHYASGEDGSKRPPRDVMSPTRRRSSRLQQLPPAAPSPLRGALNLCGAAPPAAALNMPPTSMCPTSTPPPTSTQ